MPSIIETTDNRFYRVVSEFDARLYDCIEVKRGNGGFVDKAKARPVLITKVRVIRTLAA